VANVAKSALYGREGDRPIPPGSRQGGRKELRSLLYMAAMCAVQHNSVFRDHYAQLLQRDKPRKVALVACIRKLLGILNAMLRTNQPWRDSVPTVADGTS
jgi:transposase